LERYPIHELRQEGKAYFEFLRTKDLSAGVYRLLAGATDSQGPHTEAEIYYVVSGRARFVAGERDVSVSTGDILFVPPNEPHRFHDIADDLELLVFFAPAEGTSGL